MEKARLIEPSEEYLESFFDACREFCDNGVSFQSMPSPEGFADFKASFPEKLINQSRGIGLPKGWVPSSTYWLVDDEKWIGTGNIRHALTPDLELFGGHIGYAVRRSCWNMGYGTFMLSLLLERAKALGLKKVLLTCAEDNIGSRRVMEKNGGIMQDMVINILDGKPRPTLRYWINLS